MIETWRPIPINPFNKVYAISITGRVKRLVGVPGSSAGKILKINTLQYSGYSYVGLQVAYKRKAISVHRLVALAFIPNPKNLPCVNHKDSNKKNNSIENLEWCSYKENAQHAQRAGLRPWYAGKRKLTKQSVEEINRLFHKTPVYGKGGLAEKYDVCPGTIYFAIKYASHYK